MVVFQEHWGPFVFLSFLGTFQGNTILHLPIIIELSPFWSYLQTSAFFADTVFQLWRNFFFPKVTKGPGYCLCPSQDPHRRSMRSWTLGPVGSPCSCSPGSACLLVPACPAEPGESSEAPADPGLSCRQSSASSFAYWYFEFINIDTENTA